MAVDRGGGRGRLAAAAPLLVFLLAGCSDPPAVGSVRGDPDSTELEMSVESCNGDPVVTAEESPTQVRLSVEGGDTPDDCLDSARVTLEAPLGNRTVVDEGTGKAVEVLPAEE